MRTRNANRPDASKCFFWLTAKRQYCQSVSSLWACSVYTLYTHLTDYSLHLESCDWHSRAFSQPVITLPSRGQIPLHHVAFIPTFLKHSLQPLRHERVIQAILTFVQDWLADLIDPFDPLQAFPTSSQDGCWLNRSLRRILSCISQDKQALIMKGKPRGFEASPPKQTSQHCWGGRGVFNLALCQH